MIKALILDLDNTIYPAPSISDELFEPIHELLEKHKDNIGEDNIQEIKKLMTKKAWQKIAEQFDFNEELYNQGTDILREATYDKPMQYFEDYTLLQSNNIDKYLVTMGFTKMQWSKVRMLNIESDYKEIIVNDPEKTEDTKKEVFEDLIKKYNLNPAEVLIIGDDPDSEIKAGNDLQIPTVLYDRKNEYEDGIATYRIHNFNELPEVLSAL